MLTTKLFSFHIHMLYNEPVYGARGRLAPRYGARGPLGTITLVNNYNRDCCQMSQIFLYYIA